MFRTLALAVAAALLLTAAEAAADPGGKGRHGHDQERDRDRDRGDGGYDVVIDAVERAMIRDYYRDARRDHDDYGRLPPGIRKNLARGKPLPPGLARKMPDDLRHRLPMRDGYDYQVVGADVLLVEVATGVIVDILRGALR